MESAHGSVTTMLERTRAAGEETTFDRMKAQGDKRCGFCEQGIRCSICSQGPCRITPKSPRGVCGIDADGMAMRNFLLQNTMGTATYTYHASEVFKTLAQAKPGSTYEIKDWSKLELLAQLAAAKTAEKPASRQVISQTCFNCGRSEMDAVLFPARTKGESTWVCARCLPQLIHG